MRPALFLFLALAAAVRADAQDSVRREVTLASGGTITRECAAWRSEGVAVLPADARDPGPDASAYLAKLAKAIERRVDHPVTDSQVRVASFAARVLRDGQVMLTRLVRGSEHAGFDMAAQRAASFVASDPDLVPMPPGMPDSFTVLISFGRRADGSDFLVSHVRCPVVPYPDNPKPVYPVQQTITRSRVRVRVRFLVDTAGLVDTASVVLLDPVSDAFEAATMTYLSKLRYLPEDFDGEKQRVRIERTVTIMPPDEENSGTR